MSKQQLHHTSQKSQIRELDVLYHDIINRTNIVAVVTKYHSFSICSIYLHWCPLPFSPISSFLTLPFKLGLGLTQSSFIFQWKTKPKIPPSPSPKFSPRRKRLSRGTRTAYTFSRLLSHAKRLFHFFLFPFFISFFLDFFVSTFFFLRIPMHRVDKIWNFPYRLTCACVVPNGAAFLDFFMRLLTIGLLMG